MMHLVFLIFALLISGCQNKQVDRMQQAREAIELRDYSRAESLLNEEIAETAPGSAENSEARRVLASVHVSRAGISIVDLYDFLVTLEFEFLPQARKISDIAEFRQLKSIEDAFLIWKSLPMVTLEQSMAFQNAIEIIDGDRSRTSALYRLLLESMQMKSLVSRCDLTVESNFVRAFALLSKMAIDYFQSFPDKRDSLSDDILQRMQRIKFRYDTDFFRRESQCSF